MIRNIAAAVLAMLMATAAPSLAFSKDEKSPNECGKYLAEISKALDTLVLRFIQIIQFAPIVRART